MDQFGLSGVIIDNQWPIACGGCQNEGNKNCYLIDYNMTGWEALSESRCLASRFLILTRIFSLQSELSRLPDIMT